MKDKITKDMVISDLAEKYPEAVEFLVYDCGLHCIGCHAAGSETIEDGLKAHGYSDDDVLKILKELNKIVSK